MRKFAALLALTTAVCLLYANEKGDALVKQIEAVAMPKWVTGKESDKAFMDKYLVEIASARKKKNDLILQLFQVDPNHPKTARFMQERWRFFESGNVGDGVAYAKRVVADIDAVLKTNPPKEIAMYGEIEKLNLQRNWLRSSDVEHDILSAILALDKKYPNTDEIGNMLLDLSRSVPVESRPVIFRAFIERFPKHRLAYAATGGLRQIEGIGKPFDLKFTDAITGEKYDIADHKGKVVVIDFWATWCGPCVAKMPEVKRVLDQYAEQGLEVVGISLDASEKDGGLDALKSFIAKNKYPWHQYYQGNGWESEFSQSWGIMSIPNVFLIDRKGNLRMVGVQMLETEVKKLLSEKP